MRKIKVMTTQDKNRAEEKLGIKAEVLKRLEKGDVLLVRGNYLDRVIENFIITHLNEKANGVTVIALPWAEEDLKGLYGIDEEVLKKEETIKALSDVIWKFKEAAGEELGRIEETAKNLALMQELEDLENNSRREVAALVYKSPIEIELRKVVDISFNVEEKEGKETKSAYALLEFGDKKLKVIKFSNFSLKSRNDQIENKIRECLENFENCHKLPEIEDITAESGKYMLVVELDDKDRNVFQITLSEKASQAIKQSKTIDLNQFIETFYKKKYGKVPETLPNYFNIFVVPLEGREKESLKEGAENLVEIYNSLTETSSEDNVDIERKFNRFNVRLALLIYKYAIFTGKIDEKKLEALKNNREALNEFILEVSGTVEGRFRALINTILKSYRDGNQKALVHTFEQLTRKVAVFLSNNPIIAGILERAEKESKGPKDDSSDKDDNRALELRLSIPDSFKDEIINRLTLDKCREIFKEVIRNNVIDNQYNNDEERRADRNPAGFLIAAWFMRLLSIYAQIDQIKTTIPEDCTSAEVITQALEEVNKETGIPAYYTEEVLEEVLKYLTSPATENLNELDKPCKELIKETIKTVSEIDQA